MNKKNNIGKKQSNSSAKKMANDVNDLVFGLFECAICAVCAVAGILSEAKKEKSANARKSACKTSAKSVAEKTAKPTAKSVPVEDRIAIPKRIVKECRNAVVSVGGYDFTADEQREIHRLRREGKSIKQIGKAIHRRDKAVSAFLRG